MSFLTVLLGTLVGGVISSGALIGITFLGALVPWWAILLIGIVGCLLGGFTAGLFARGGLAGAIAGFLTGFIVLIAIFLFAWLYYKAQVLDWYYNTFGGNIDDTITALITTLGMDETTGVGQKLSEALHQMYTDYGGNIDDLVASYFPVFGLIIGAIFGGLCSVVNIFAGLIGGLFTRKKEKYDTYQ